jgi:hypothetical protein
MSILDGIQKTEAEKRFEQIMEATPKIVKGEKNRCVAMFNLLWGSESEPLPIETCQEIIDMFGNEAYQVFQIHQTWQEFIKTVDTEYVKLVSPYDVTVNADGTVTLSEKESSSESE